VIVTPDAKRRLSIPVTLEPPKPGDRFDARFGAKRCPLSTDDLLPHSRELPKKLKVFDPFKELPSD
jgi:hypothetical protein